MSATAAHYFLHIPKTAGTALIDWLRASGRFRVCPHGLWSLLLQADRDSLSDYDLFCGHFYRYLQPYVGRPLVTFTFLRNPLDRAFSHYRHIVRDPNHYFHERVRAQGSFEAFLGDPVTRPLGSNFQTRALATLFNPVSQQAALGSTRRYALEEFLETAPSGLSEDDELALAKDCLHRCVFVGISERMDESAALLANVLGLSSHVPPQRLNLDAEGAAPWSPAEWRLVTEYNRNDLRLYEYALVLFERQGAASRHGTQA